jgi:hypothetical protein
MTAPGTMFEHCVSHLGLPCPIPVHSLPWCLISPGQSPTFPTALCALYGVSASSYLSPTMSYIPVFPVAPHPRIHPAITSLSGPCSLNNCAFVPVWACGGRGGGGKLKVLFFCVCFSCLLTEARLLADSALAPQHGLGMKE